MKPLPPDKRPKSERGAQKRAAKEADTALAQSPLSRDVDELGDLDAWANTFAAITLSKKFDRIDVLRKAIRERFADAPAGEEQRADGERYVCLLGVQSAPCPMAFTRAGSRTLKVVGKGE